MEEFQAWKVCWKVNLPFYRILQEKLTCITCGRVEEPSGGTRRSFFWSEAIQCLAGHSLVRMENTINTGSIGICSSCDQDFVFNVVKGKLGCKQDGCRRILRVDAQRVRARLKDDHKTLQYGHPKCNVKM
jgi:hypothetical protein